jgi:hypothetical protein
MTEAGVAYCACLDGYHPMGLACEADDPARPCDEVDCSGHGECRADAGGPWCECDPGYHHPEGTDLLCLPDVTDGGEDGPDGVADDGVADDGVADDGVGGSDEADGPEDAERTHEGDAEAVVETEAGGEDAGDDGPPGVCAASIESVRLADGDPLRLQFEVTNTGTVALAVAPYADLYASAALEPYYRELGRVIGEYIGAVGGTAPEVRDGLGWVPLGIGESATVFSQPVTREANWATYNARLRDGGEDCGTAFPEGDPPRLTVTDTSGAVRMAVGGGSAASRTSSSGGSRPSVSHRSTLSTPRAT